MKSVHPYKKPMSGPMDSRRKTYCPPARGNIAASSPYASAPSSVMMPVRIHATSTNQGEWTLRPMSAETMKIPEPIIEPATSIVASVSVMALTNSDCGCVAVSFAIMLRGSGCGSRVTQARHTNAGVFSRRGKHGNLCWRKGWTLGQIEHDLPFHPDRSAVRLGPGTESIVAQHLIETPVVATVAGWRVLEAEHPPALVDVELHDDVLSPHRRGNGERRDEHLGRCRRQVLARASSGTGTNS